MCNLRASEHACVFSVNFQNSEFSAFRMCNLRIYVYFQSIGLGQTRHAIDVVMRTKMVAAASLVSIQCTDPASGSSVVLFC